MRRDLHKVNLGSFRLTGTIEQQVETQSATTNEPIVVWEAVASNIRFGKFRQSGREIYEADKETAVGSVVLNTHFMSGIDEKMRLVSHNEKDGDGNDFIYAFVEVYPDDSRRFLHIVAEKRT